MTAPRKRKAPEKKSVRRPPGLAVRATLAAGNLVAARPSLFGGIIAFGVVFSFVAANALWYQPRHPHPFLNTRDAFRNYQQASSLNADPADVTTYRIERQGSETDAPASVIAPNGPKAAGFPSETPSSELVLQTQQQLANLGFYDGTVDGQMGTKTMAAIQFYQDKNGLPATGQPSTELLSALRVTNGQAAIVPQDRPSGDVTTNSTSPDPVAAAIEDAAKPIVEPMVPPKPIPEAKTTKAVSAPAPVAATQKSTPAPAAPKPVPAKTAASKAAAPAKAASPVKAAAPVKMAAPKPTAAPKPVVTPKPLAEAKPAAQPAPIPLNQKPATPKPTTILGLLKAHSQSKQVANPVKATPIDTAEALPAVQPKAAKSIDTAQALPAAQPKKAKPVETASAQPTRAVAPAKTAAPAAQANAVIGKPSSQVLKIQQGLAKSYPHVAVTGVAGPETKAAIRNFEKNYNMPVTGEPSEALLKKMKSLGVL